MKTVLQIALFSGLAIASGFLAAGSRKTAGHPAPSPSPHPAERGEYLVKLGGCADCHTPKIMTAKGPADDETRLFSGHPADVILPPPALQPGGPWGAATAGMTAWTGPWGISYASNLTPDLETGLGGWSRENFVKAMKTGKHKGEGRDILPPMPWQPLAAATEEDLTAIHAYLQSLPPIKNQVPQPSPPALADASK